MKKLFVLSFLVVLFKITTVVGQAVELRPIALYTFQESFPISAGEAIIREGSTFGAELGLVLNEMIDVNFTYLFMKTDMDIRTGFGLPTIPGSGVNIANYQLGFNHQRVVGAKDNIKPYAGIKIGVLNAAYDNPTWESSTKMSVGFNLGTKIMFTEKVGINLMALLQSPVSGFGLGIGTGGASVGTYSYVFQFSLGGGLVFKLK